MQSQFFTVLGHRGAKGHAPENTLPSFEKGIELGATMLELDIHPSRDKRLVVMHDALVDRTTDGSGPVREMTLQEIQRLDAGGWYHPQYRGTRVPSLDEVIALTRGRIRLNVEVKRDADGGTYDGVCELLAETLVATGTVGEVVVSSFAPAYLTALRRLLPDLELGLLYSKSTGDEVRQAQDEGWNALHPHLRLVDAEFVARAHVAGLLVRAWNPNEVAEMRPLMVAGVDGIGTDFPERLRALAQEMGRPLER